MLCNDPARTSIEHARLPFKFDVVRLFGGSTANGVAGFLYCQSVCKRRYAYERKIEKNPVHLLSVDPNKVYNRNSHDAEVNPHVYTNVQNRSRRLMVWVH